MFCLCFVMQCCDADCFTLIVFRTSCDWLCSVALPHEVGGWSAVCDCGIS